MRAKSLQLCLTLCYPMDCSPPGSSVYGLSSQEYWSGVPLPSPGDLPDPGIEPVSLTSPTLAGRFSTTSATSEAQLLRYSWLTILHSFQLYSWSNCFWGPFSFLWFLVIYSRNVSFDAGGSWNSNALPQRNAFLNITLSGCGSPPKEMFVQGPFSYSQ